MSDPRSIGVFDSGIGGLTVLAAMRRRLPGERFLYLGDTARLPYGTKSSETVVRYAQRAGTFLADRGVKLLVVACNTASATALPALEASLPIPVVGVVVPGARAAVAATGGHIGVIGTESTIASGAYPRAIREHRADVDVVALPCPLFVPLAEEGWLDHPVTRQVAAEYLRPLVEAEIDTLILGCTHYPLLRTAIAEAVGGGVTLVDSAEAVAEEVAALIAERRLSGDGGNGVDLMVTDAAARFSRIAGLILGPTAGPLELIDLPG